MDNVNVFHLVVAPNWEKDLSKMATSNHSLELIENHRLNQTCGYLWIPQLYSVNWKGFANICLRHPLFPMRITKEKHELEGNLADSKGVHLAMSEEKTNRSSTHATNH
ncbi:hypothetical protein OUZ56_017414 [Daphnia magna]|uniref:Uncharacterized protein n=1 Tax=Daphnia magna TaxID=35525 RepID=A0ABR0ASS3_9CRUS|nr:hypothetical protein OUZ56_017414 [Daphnia magna]